MKSAKKKKAKPAAPKRGNVRAAPPPPIPRQHRIEAGAEAGHDVEPMDMGEDEDVDIME